MAFKCHLKYFCVLALLAATVSARADSFRNERHIVAIDVGHSEKNPGAISATGIPEYEFNLRIAERVRALLLEAPGVEPFIISSSNSTTLTDRSKAARVRNADLLISIHHDSAQDKYLIPWEVDGRIQNYTDQFSGYSVFVSRKNPRIDDSFDAAQRIGTAMAAGGFRFATHHNEAIRGENRPIIDSDAGIYAFDNLVVLKTAAMPAVLVECGVIVNRAEEKLLLTDEHQRIVATAIAKGVVEHFSQRPLAKIPPVLGRYLTTNTGARTPADEGINATRRNISERVVRNDAEIPNAQTRRSATR